MSKKSFFFFALLIVTLSFLAGCVTNRSVVENEFISDSNPVANIKIPANFIYLGTTKNMESSTSSTLTWVREAYLFAEDSNKDKVLDKGVDIVLNKISSYFVSNYFGNTSKFISKGYVEINGKMCPTVTYAVQPSPAGFLTRFVTDKGYAQPDLVLVNVRALRIRNDLMLEVGYFEDVSHLDYKKEDWNVTSLDEKQKAYLNEFLARAHTVVSLANVQHN